MQGATAMLEGVVRRWDRESLENEGALEMRIARPSEPVHPERAGA
jgi:hypothetical protein